MPPSKGCNFKIISHFVKILEPLQNINLQESIKVVIYNLSATNQKRSNSKWFWYKISALSAGNYQFRFMLSHIHLIIKFHLVIYSLVQFIFFPHFLPILLCFITLLSVTPPKLRDSDTKNVSSTYDLVEWLIYHSNYCRKNAFLKQ